MVKKVLKTSSFQALYRQASVKFVWEYQDIEDYISLISRSLDDTYRVYLEEDVKVKPESFGEAVISDEKKKPEYYVMYILDIKPIYRGTAYSYFKWNYGNLARGYIRDELGARTPRTKDNFLELWQDILKISKDQAIKMWEETQFFKRPITSFQTLANKSLNRRRRVTPKKRMAVLKRDNFTCALCGRSKKDGVKLQVDHREPVIKGGGNDMDDLITLCQDCNLGKGVSLPQELKGFL